MQIEIFLTKLHRKIFTLMIFVSEIVTKINHYAFDVKK